MYIGTKMSMRLTALTTLKGRAGMHNMYDSPRLDGVGRAQRYYRHRKPDYRAERELKAQMQTLPYDGDISMHPYVLELINASK